MHVGFITPEYPYKGNKDSIGGIGTFVHNLAVSLVNEKQEVTVFLYSQLEQKVFYEKGIKIHLVAIKKMKGLTWFTNRRNFIKYVNRVVKEKNIDVLEAPEWTGFTAFMKFNCPLVIRLHGSDTYFCHLEKRKVKFKNYWYEKLALLGADKIVGVSNFVSYKTNEIFGLKKEIKTIYNTVDIGNFVPNHINRKSNNILYYGTLVRKKGVLEIPFILNELLKKNKEIQFICLGKDNIDVFTGVSTLEMMKKNLSKEALDVFTYIPQVPYSDVKKHIESAEVIVLPSFAEAFPMTWLEAMAMEKKLVTSNIGWAKELMINGETGYTVNPKNHIQFAEKIDYLLRNDKEVYNMTKKARNRISNDFNLGVILKENIDMYKSLTKNKLNEV